MTDSTRWLRTLLEQAKQPTTAHQSPAPGNPPPDVLVRLDPITTAPDPDTIAAAVVYARRRHAEAEPQLLWARYASTAARNLWDKAHPTAIRAATTYHNVLVSQGLTFDAVRIRQDQLDIYRELGDPTRILAARCGLALALHRDRQCDTAEEQIRLVLRQWWGSPHGYGHASLVLLVAASIHAGCGRTTEAQQLLTRDAAHLTHLNPGDRHLAAQWLTTVAVTHPTGCSLRTPETSPVPGDDGQRAFWLGALRPCPTDDSRRRTAS